MQAKNRFVIVFVIFIVLAFNTTTSYGFTNNITVNIPSRTIYFVSQMMSKLYPIAVGKIVSTSPLGTYRIINKQVNPKWISPWTGEVIPSGPDNPLGYRWMGFYSDYGIHGNNMPSSIGTLASSGCIRMYEADVEELFDMVNYGDIVNIVYQTMFIKTSPTGGKALFVYPDFYKKGLNTRQSIKSQLQNYGIKVSYDTFEKLYKYINVKDPLVFSEGYKVVKSNELVSSDVYRSQDGQFYMDVGDLKGYLNIDDEKIKDLKSVSVDNVSYVNIDDIANLTGLKFVVDNDTNTIKMIGNVIYYDGKFLSTTNYVDYQNRDIYIPIKEFFTAAGHTVEWDSQKGVTVDGKSIKYKIYESKSYINQKDLKSLYGLNIIIDSSSNKIYIKRD
ncbi:L,D-transpeptidase family protein [Thermoanaerobacterium sp. R66]|nr:L,D-transpeptidase family protein [Thermoanaerobacterium sp. R66]MDE4541496.1 L,D-transpeptidase family protein [Thermoanaerobacterium sp. R66]